ncbi:MAG TPA: VOC family protein [Arenimonas sp.]|nr:VOC family protein [Arenimonas sp.]
MKYLHAMVRVRDLEESIKFYRDALGLIETRRKDYPQGRFTLVYLAAPENPDSEVELTYNYDDEDYGSARNFGHLAFAVNNIYETCEQLRQHGVVINRPPRDGRMAFVRSPDSISIELLQKGEALAPQEPWLSMQNIGSW